MDEPTDWTAVCAADLLLERGKAVRFIVDCDGEMAPAFAVRVYGKVRAYLNRCTHVPVELDWQPGDLFDLSRQFFVCSIHGAYYSPEDGHCMGGPCRGGLTPVPIKEEGGQVWSGLPVQAGSIELPTP